MVVLRQLVCLSSGGHFGDMRFSFGTSTHAMSSGHPLFSCTRPRFEITGRSLSHDRTSGTTSAEGQNFRRAPPHASTPQGKLSTRIRAAPQVTGGPDGTRVSRLEMDGLFRAASTRLFAESGRRLPVGICDSAAKNWCKGQNPVLGLCCGGHVLCVKAVSKPRPVSMPVVNAPTGVIFLHDASWWAILGVWAAGRAHVPIYVMVPLFCMFFISAACFGHLAGHW